MEEDKIRQQARKLINEKYPYLPFDQWGYFENMFINGWNQALSIANVVGRSEQYCEHAVTDQKTLRCTCCEECGEILDVID